MPVQVKICGINSSVAADAALAAGADFTGLVFFAKSPRNLSLEAGQALSLRLKPRAKLVALVADAEDGLLARIAGEVKPDYFQLHGQETPARAAAIQSRFDVPIIKAIGVAAPDDLAKVEPYDMAEMVLFDALPATGASRPGGHGAAFDWQMLKDRRFAKPWFLAGGLNPDNVARAIESSGAAMVDVSSGVESAPGVKNAGLIESFIAAAKSKVRA